MNFKIFDFQLKIHKDGLPFLGVFFFIFLISLLIRGVTSFSIISCFMILLVYFFFRDPDRVQPTNIESSGDILSPSDGKVLNILSSKLPLASSDSEDFWKIEIIISPIDTGVLRSPLSGIINSITSPLHESSLLNESNNENNNTGIFSFKNKQSIIYIIHSFGIFSKNISIQKKEGEDISVGERLGIMKFGVKYRSMSLFPKFEIYIPKKFELKIQNGQTLIGGETIIASNK